MDYLLQLKHLGLTMLAMLLGAVVGMEREIASKPAGMRTHMLVAGAAALLVMLGDTLVNRFGTQFNTPVIRSDPIRIIQAIVTGVAFLGAGTIIREGRSNAVKGLTTAATLLFTAGVGICIAVRQVLLGSGATVLALVTLRIVHTIETRLKNKATPPA